MLVLEVKKTPSGKIRQLQRSAQHVEHADVLSEPKCPKCGASMTVRVARKGTNAGKEFWGCTKYPNCHGILPVKTD